LPDDQAGRALEDKGTAMVEDVERAIGTSRRFLREEFSQDGVTEHGGRADGGNNRPKQIRWQRQLCEQRKLTGDEETGDPCQDLSRSDTVLTQPIGHSAQEQRSSAERNRHDEEVPDDPCSVQPVDIGKPWRRPQSLQRPGSANTGGRKRRETPKARIGIDGLQADRRRTRGH
jgi:hypothetical protein